MAAAHRLRPAAGLLGVCMVALLLACEPRDEAPAAGQQAQAMPAACGAVRVARLPWASAELLAEVDALILRLGLGCEVTWVRGDTVPTLRDMLAGEGPDLLSEAWIDALRPEVEAALADGRLLRAGPALSDGAREGWWVPRALLQAHPGLRTLNDALHHPALFAGPASAGRGQWHGCPSGWACRVSTAHAFRAWEGAARGFVLVQPESPQALEASLAEAVAQGRGWLGYHWAPSTLVARYDLVPLAAGVAVNEAALACWARPDCVAPNRSDWPVAEVPTLVDPRWARRAGAAYAYLQSRSWETHTVSALLAWQAAQGASAEDTARHFLRTQPQVWADWLPEDAARAVRRALG